MIKSVASILESRWVIFLIIFTSLAMHLGVINKDLVGFHVWRQTQTQSTILSFAEEDLNIFNPRRNDRGNGDGIFRMEFPLPQWITALPVKLLGNDVLISRIMNFLYSLLSIFGIYYLVRRIFNSSQLAALAAWLLTFTPVFYYYSVNPMPDNLALTFSIWGLFFMIKWYREGRRGSFILMSVFFALSGLCKLPFALVFVVPGLLLIRRFFSEDTARRKTIMEGFILVCGFLPILSWYIWVIPDWEGNGIVSGIFAMDDEQKNNFWYYLWFNLRTNIPELIIGLISLPFFVWGVISAPRLRRKSGYLSLVFLIWFFLMSVLIIFEMNMIKTVHDYYFIPFLPILVLISVFGLSRLLSLAGRKRWIWIPVVLLLLSMPVYSYFRINPRWERVGFNEDLLIYKEELRNAVPDSALVCAGNDQSHHIFLYYINKKGWSFEQNWMGKKKLEGLMSQGCEYLYSDSRHIEQNPGIQNVFGTKVATFGNINIFKLRNPVEGDELRKK